MVPLIDLELYSLSEKLLCMGALTDAASLLLSPTGD